MGSTVRSTVYTEEVHMDNIKCKKCKSKIEKVASGAMYCAKTNPIRRCIIMFGSDCPSWCPKKKK